MTERLLAALLTQALLFSLAVSLLALLRRPLSRLGAGVLYASWLLLPALLLTPVLPRPAQEPLRLALHATGGAVLPAPPALPTPADHQARVGLSLWLSGSLLFVLSQVRRQWRLARTGSHLPAGSSPALVGLFRPRIALPADFEQRFPPAQRALILAHEAVHRERLDNLWNLLACALAALHWWNPLAWWAARRFRADQELACDAAVLATRPEARADYTRALLAAHDLHHLGAPLASRWGTTHPLIERIAMLDHVRPLTRRQMLPLAAAMAGLSTLAYAVEAPTPASGGFIEMQLMVERIRSNEKSSVHARLIGRDGERMTVRIDGIAGDTPNWTTEPLSISLWPRQQGDAALIKSEIQIGEPAVEIGHPSVLSAWGTKARIEIGRPESGEKLVLELTPTRAPADFKPPKKTF